MILGNIGGYNVTYSAVTDTVNCKDVVIPAQKLLDGYESGLDRYNLGVNLVLRKYVNEFTMGCLRVETSIGKELIKQIKNVRQCR